MRRVEQVRPAGIEHRAPARRRRLDAEAEEAQRRLRDDRARHPSVACTTTAGSAVGRTWRRTIRAELGAERARRLHVLELARAQHLAAHQPRVAHPADHRQRQHDVGQARTEHGDERNRQQDPGKRHQHVDHPADHIVDPPAEVAGDRAEQHADERRHRHDREADEQRDARARRAGARGCRARARRGRTDARGSAPPAAARSSCADGSYGRQTRARRRAATTASDDDDEADADHHS